uniref:Ig-like domain-containing protein n=1 Tax=Capra hircus TaxID=9925 RepID=A0A8C2PFZ4_CAPHI
IQRNFQGGYLSCVFSLGVMSAVVLVPQDQEKTVPVGKSVTLSCSMKGAMFISKHYIFWYRKTPGNTMTFIYREEGVYGPGFEDNFRGKIDNSTNQAIVRNCSTYCTSLTVFLELHKRFGHTA